MAELRAGFFGRNGFGPFCGGKGLTKLAVEVGTDRGLFAYQFLCGWPGEGVLHCVDPWVHYSAKDPASRKVRIHDKATAEALLYHFVGRHSLHNFTSAIAAPTFRNESCCFVYIDADHEEIAQDISLWWPKVRPGGILAGHDIVCPGEPDGLWGPAIKQALFAFSDRVNLPVHVVPEFDGSPWSWYVEKPQ